MLNQMDNLTIFKEFFFREILKMPKKKLFQHFYSKCQKKIVFDNKVLQL